MARPTTRSPSLSASGITGTSGGAAPALGSAGAGGRRSSGDVGGGRSGGGGGGRSSGGGGGGGGGGSRGSAPTAGVGVAGAPGPVTVPSAVTPRANTTTTREPCSA